MENNPQVAIMMPVYNGEKTLPLAISSLVHQTYQNWKCYIVNDGSTDRTKEILDGINDERFVIIHFDKNKGRPYARQAALEATEGKYLAFLDADDFYHLNKLKHQVSILENNPDVYLISCIMASFDKEYNLKSVRPKNGFDTPRTYHYHQEFTPSRAGSMIKIKQAKSIKYDLTLKYAQDTDYFSRYLKGKEYLVLNEVLYYYSEFESVTAKKILDTYKYKFLRTQKKLKYYPLRISVNLIFILLKWGAVFFTIKLKGVNYLLEKRGKHPEVGDIEMFNQCYNKIHNR